MDSKTLAGQIADYDSKRVTSVDAMNEAAAQFGLPEIRKNVAGMRTTIANTQNSLNAVDPSVTGRTQGSLVTEAQRQRQVANERAPIAEQLQGQTGAYQTATGDLKDAESNATMLATSRVNDWQAGRQALQGRYDMVKQREDDDLAHQLASEQERRRREESDREYALSKQSMNIKAAAGGGNQTLNKQQVTSAIRQGLESVKGRDNHVAPADLARAHSDWLSSGLAEKDFWTAFQGYWNPKQGNYKDQFNAAH
jgi:hypothetical protein